MSTLTEKWNVSGLLDSLSDSGKEKMAQLLENTLKMIEGPNFFPAFGDAEPNFWKHNILPIVRRLFEKFVERDDFFVTDNAGPIINEKQYYMTTRWIGDMAPVTFDVVKFNKEFSRNNSYTGLDWEGEMIEAISNEFIAKLKIQLEKPVIVYTPIIPSSYGIDPTSEEIRQGYFIKYKNI